MEENQEKELLAKDVALLYPCLLVYINLILGSNHCSNKATGYPSDYVAPSHRISGYTHRDQVHVRFQRGWLILPVLLLVLVAIPLVGTIRYEPLAFFLRADWRPHPSILMQESTSVDTERSVEELRARVEDKVWLGDTKQKVISQS